MNARLMFVGISALFACGCAVDLPSAPPPLADMEEPPALLAEPDDEAARRALPKGSFTGVVAAESAAPATLDDLAGGAEAAGGAGVFVARVIENSPADAAGLAEGDILLEAWIGDGAPTKLGHVSDWRGVELAAPVGAKIRVTADRARVRIERELVAVARVRPADRAPVERFREEARVGVVLRTATEAEAREAGLPPGAGAVVTGLARGSPWRAAGLAFQDLVCEADGAVVAHPSDLVRAARDAPPDGALRLACRRRGARFEIVAPVSRRTTEARRAALPPLFDYESARGETEFSLLLGLVKISSTPAAWDLRLLWFIGFGGGDADRLESVPTPDSRPAGPRP